MTSFPDSCRFEILHKGQQWCCRDLCKISKRLGNWKITLEHTRSLDQCWTIIWTNASILLIRSLGTTDLIETKNIFHTRKSIWKYRCKKDGSHFVSASTHWIVRGLIIALLHHHNAQFKSLHIRAIVCDLRPFQWLICYRKSSRLANLFCIQSISNKVIATNFITCHLCCRCVWK